MLGVFTLCYAVVEQSMICFCILGVQRPPPEVSAVVTKSMPDDPIVLKMRMSAVVDAPLDDEAQAQARKTPGSAVTPKDELNFCVEAWTQADTEKMLEQPPLPSGADAEEAVASGEQAKADAAQAVKDREQAKADAAQPGGDGEQTKADAAQAKADAEELRTEA